MKLIKITTWRIVIFTILTLGSIIVILGICVNNDWKNVFIGFLASFLTVLLIEIINVIYNCRMLSKLKGTYKRIKITNVSGQKQPDGGVYDDLTERYNTQKVNSEIRLKYNGEGEYIGTASYEEGEVEFTINLNRSNPKTGTGIYQYINKTEPDLGIYDIQVDKNCNDRIYVKYSNVIPSGNAQGYEIWEKDAIKIKSPQKLI
jgi:ABC-type transport system involved in multi-copper enzyme maturation permease subunit